MIHPNECQNHYHSIRKVVLRGCLLLFNNAYLQQWTVKVRLELKVPHTRLNSSIFTVLALAQIIVIPSRDCNPQEHLDIITCTYPDRLRKLRKELLDCAKKESC